MEIRLNIIFEDGYSSLENRKTVNQLHDLDEINNWYYNYFYDHGLKKHVGHVYLRVRGEYSAKNVTDRFAQMEGVKKVDCHLIEYKYLFTGIAEDESI